MASRTVTRAMGCGFIAALQAHEHAHAGVHYAGGIMMVEGALLYAGTLMAGRTAT